MSNEPSGFRAAVGSKWLTFTPGYAWLMPLWFSASILSTNNLNGWDDLLIVFVINTIALAVCSIEYLVFRKTIWRAAADGGTAIVPFILVLAGGLAFGASKAVVTAFVSHLILGTAIEDLSGRVVAASLLGILVVLVVPVVMAQLEKYRVQRANLITDLVRREVSAESSAATQPELTKFISTALKALESVRDAPQTLPDVLDDMRDNEIRPLSHRIWQREQARIPEFTLSNMIALSLSKMNFLVVPVVVSFAVIAAPTNISGYGLVEGTVALGIQSAVLAIGLSLAKLLPPGGTLRGIFAYVTVAITISLAIEIITNAVLGQIPSLLPVQSVLSVLQLLLSLILFTGAFSLTRQTRKSMDFDLLAHSPNLVSTELTRVKQARTDRELAQLLHSQVQNVFLAKAVMLRTKIEDSEVSGLQKQELLESTLLELENYIEALNVSVPAGPNNSESLGSFLERLRELWGPGVNISLPLFNHVEQHRIDTYAEQLAAVISEAITNSVRHGMARNVAIGLATTETTITLTVNDDGFGPRNGSPGLGTLTYSTIANSTWGLTRSSGMGGACFRLIIAI